MASRIWTLRICVIVLVACIALPLFQKASSSSPWHFLNVFKPSTATDDLALIARNHRYAIQVVSKDPLMIYMDEFLHPHEAQYLIELGQTKFKPSKVYTDPNDEEWPSPSYRTSHSSVLNNNDPIVSIIRERAYFVLGFIPFIGVEAFQLVRYRDGDLFGMHYDWFTSPLVDEKTGAPYNRVASFFIYLEANCSSGATYFPRLPPPPESLGDTGRYSTTKNQTGLAVLPRLGSGVFWLNLMNNGLGDERLLHAGLPVTSGSKIGLNIWIKGRV